jgi:hypothetical protein
MHDGAKQEVTCTDPQVLYSSQRVYSALDTRLNTVNNDSRDANAISSNVTMNAYRTQL